MYRYFFIAKNNIKKQKSDMITFFIMVLISAMMLFISLSFMTGVKNVIDKVHDSINGPDMLFTMADDKNSINKLDELIEGNPYMGDHEMTETISVIAEYGHKNDKEMAEFSFQFISYEQDINIQKISCRTSNLKGNEIIIPIRMSTGFKIGDILRIKIEDNIYDFKVADYAEDSIYCSPMNMGVNVVYVSEDEYNKILFDNSNDPQIKSIMYKVKLNKNAIRKRVNADELCESIYNEHNNWYIDYVKTHPDSKGGIYNSIPCEMLKESAMILPMMFIGIVCMFAIIIFIIAMVIIHFSVKNFIMTNMRNTAIMEAAGYTVKELIAILVFQLGTVVLLAGILGVTVGVFSIDHISIIIIMTLGLSWNQPLNIFVVLGVVIGILIIVCILTVVIGMDYNRTTVLDALRGGINAHNFKRNYFSFEKSVFPVPVTFSLKETFGRFRSQIGIIFIMMILTVSVVFGLGMSDTFSGNDALMKMAGVDYADAEVSGDLAMHDHISGMKCVDSLYGNVWQGLNYTSSKVRDNQVITTRAFTDISLCKGITPIEGRFPLHSNEIMFATNAANRLKVEVGDVVTVSFGSQREEYLVTGLCQVLNNMGIMAYISVEGVEKITGQIKNYGYEIFLKEGYDLEDFKKEFAEVYPEVEVIDFKKNAEGTVGVIKAGVKAVAVLIAFLTSLIVAFVEFLIIKTQITRSWRDLGVSKALGYTSGQLILQATLSNIPSVIIGIVLGLIVSTFSAEKIMKLLFSLFGFKKAVFFVNPGSYVLAVILIVGIAMITSAMVGRRIRKLEPVKMITED